jgi:hypothetical protein
MCKGAGYGERLELWSREEKIDASTIRGSMFSDSGAHEIG